VIIHSGREHAKWLPFQVSFSVVVTFLADHTATDQYWHDTVMHLSVSL